MAVRDHGLARRTPEAVIEKERAKLEEGEKALAKLKEQFETIKAL